VEKFEGMLRRLAEKELILDTHDQGMLRFRLLARTQFRNRKGEPVRELLLKPGDQLEVQCDADDPETARVVVFLREGTAAEREAAARHWRPPRPLRLLPQHRLRLRAQAPPQRRCRPHRSPGKSRSRIR
jgi:hypothetical protein